MSEQEKWKYYDNTSGAQIKRLIKRYGLSHQATADMLHVSIHTIRAWLRPTSNKAYNPAPRMAVKLLRLKTTDMTVIKKPTKGADSVKYKH